MVAYNLVRLGVAVVLALDVVRPEAMIGLVFAVGTLAPAAAARAALLPTLLTGDSYVLGRSASTAAVIAGEECVAGTPPRSPRAPIMTVAFAWTSSHWVTVCSIAARHAYRVGRGADGRGHLPLVGGHHARHRSEPEPSSFVVVPAAPGVSGAWWLAGTGTYPYPPVGRQSMSDANVRIPIEARNRLAEIAAAEGMSLRAYLARLAERMQTPAERAAQAARARDVLHAWNGYAPSPEEEAQLDAELDRRIAEAVR